MLCRGVVLRTEEDPGSEEAGSGEETLGISSASSQ